MSFSYFFGICPYIPFVSYVQQILLKELATKVVQNVFRTMGGFSVFTAVRVSFLNSHG